MKKRVSLILSVFVVSAIIYLLIPLLIKQFPALQHIVINYYLLLLRRTIIFLPFAVLIYFITLQNRVGRGHLTTTSLGRFLDYERYVVRLKPSIFLILIFVLSMLATIFISWRCYHNIPYGDTTPVYYQAKILMTGHRWAPAPVYPEFFNDRMVTNNGRYFSMSPLGYSIILVMGFLFGIPWIIGPLLGSLSLIVFYFILKELFRESGSGDPDLPDRVDKSQKIARVGAVFLLLSPTFLFISASFLNQNSSLFFLLLGFLLFIKVIFNSQSPIPKPHLVVNGLLFLSGLCIGFAFLCRPTLPLAFVVSIILFVIASRRRSNPIHIKLCNSKLLFFILGFLVFVVIQAYDNLILTGHPFKYGYSLYGIPNHNEPGFGVGKGGDTYNIYGHTPLKASINLIYNLFVFSLHLFGWPLLSLGFVLIWLFSRNKGKMEKFSMGFIICSVIAVSFFWFHGISPEGPKYYYELVPFLVLLTVCGIERMRVNIKPFITLLFLIDIFVYIPQATKIFTVWGGNLYCYNETKKQDLRHNAIIFVRRMDEKNETAKSFNMHTYPSLSVRNEVDIGKSDIIYAQDLGEEQNIKLKKLYPTRKSYIFEYLNEGKSYHLIPD